MFNRPFALAIAILGTVFVATSGANAVEKETVGNAKIVVKTVTGTLESDQRQIKLLDDIYHNELIETGDDSATEFVFLDETTLALGPNSSLVLDRFIFDPDPEVASFVMTATTGVFRFVSGNLPKASYQINTPTATIGIRGTIFNVAVIPQDDDGSVVKVNITLEKGMAEIVNCRGDRVKLEGPGQSTTISGSRDGQNCSVPTRPGPQPPEFSSMFSASNLVAQ